MAVSVQRQRDTSAPDDAFEQVEIAASVLVFAEQGERDDTGSIIHREEQSEPGTAASQPIMIAAIHLNQHPFLRHPLPPQAMPWGPAMARAGNPGVPQYLAHGGACQRDAFSLLKHLRHVRMIEAGVACPRQHDHPVPELFRERIARSAAPIAMG